jgi:predicted alpha/beta-fold hydrolase
MPLVPSSFKPPSILRPAWIQTIAPALLRRRRTSHGVRETLNLADGDRLELVWHPPISMHAPESAPPRGVIVLTHGLEGSCESSYIIGLTRACTTAGYLVLAWNMRGCGGTPNSLPSWYHSGQSDDLAKVIEYARARHPELPLFAVGISVGGNILCKCLGEQKGIKAGDIRAAVAVSAPLDLRGSAETLAHPSRRIYMEYLLRPLRARIREKARRFPGLFTTEGLDSITTFREFDTRYTAPLHGFASVDDYWDSSSGLQYLKAITTPLLVLTARDDPFLSPTCLPEQLAADSGVVSLEAPEYGGHVGFIESIIMNSSTWLEHRVVTFIEEHFNTRHLACAGNLFAN